MRHHVQQAFTFEEINIYANPRCINIADDTSSIDNEDNPKISIISQHCKNAVTDAVEAAG